MQFIVNFYLAVECAQNPNDTLCTIFWQLLRSLWLAVVFVVFHRAFLLDISTGGEIRFPFRW